MAKAPEEGALSAGLAVGCVGYGRALCLDPVRPTTVGPMSRLFSSHNESTSAAEVEAWCIYERLISVPAACSVFGVVLV